MITEQLDDIGTRAKLSGTKVLNVLRAQLNKVGIETDTEQEPLPDAEHVEAV